jgi:peptidoglycan/LPS O-acetylase OafA/YrhL
MKRPPPPLTTDELQQLRDASIKNVALPSHPKYRPDIDGLRAVAIVSVLLFHAFPSLLPSGFVGVDIFFVISGFLITTIIATGLQHESFSFIDFWSRRIRRIFPALLVVLLACTAAGWFLLLPDEFKELGKHLASAAAFVVNFTLWQESGYFDSAAETKPLLHLWSLGIEEQFYILWPLILWSAHKLKVPKLPLTLFLLAISFGANVTTIATDAVATFYSPLTRAWELLIGAVLALLMLEANTPQPSMAGKLTRLASERWVLPLIRIGLIAAALVYTPAKAFPGWWGLLPTLGAAALILSTTPSWSQSILSSRLLVGIGKISYPMYLWHWPLLAFARIIEGDAPSIMVIVTALIATVLLASATYFWIEKPIRQCSFSPFIPPTLITAMLVLGLAGGGVYLNNGVPQREAAVHDADIRAQFEGSNWKYTTNDICKANYPDHYRYFCIQNREGSPTMILLGDSFANALYAGLINNPYLKDEVILSYGSCSPHGGSEENCQTQDRIIQSTPTLRYALLNAWWPRFDAEGRLLNHFDDSKVLSSSIADQYRASLDNRITMLESQGTKVFLFGPKPEIDYDIKYCFARPLKAPSKSCRVSEAERHAQQQHLLTILREVLEKHPRVTFFDQNEMLCKAGGCSLISDEHLPMLRDNGHYSQYGSTLVINAFVAQAQREGHFTAK